MEATMTRGGALLILIILLLTPSSSAATQRFPWTFGMTKQEVRSVTQYGPYRSFTNGDLETYDGMLDGRKQDFQFFFKEGKLVRIGVDLYEGQDLAAASAEWLSLYKWLNAQFGSVESRGIDPPTGSGVVFQGLRK